MEPSNTGSKSNLIIAYFKSTSQPSCEQQQQLEKLMFGEQVNLDLRKHGESVKDWDFQPLAQELYNWSQRFDFEFELKLPQVVITFNKIRKGTYATYQIGRSGFGTRYTITINTKYLKDKYYRTLRRLLHECLHCWEELYGKAKSRVKSKSNARCWYHSAQFIKKAMECGLLTNHRGYDLGHNKVFSSLLMKYGVDAPETEGEPSDEFENEGFDDNSSKLKKWSCGCTNTWCAVELNAQCLKCREIFEKEKR